MKTRDTFGDYNYWELFDIKNLKPKKTTTTKMKEKEQVTTSTDKQTTEKIKDEDLHSMNNFTITMSVSFEDMPTTCDCKILK